MKPIFEDMAYLPSCNVSRTFLVVGFGKSWHLNPSLRNVLVILKASTSAPDLSARFSDVENFWKEAREEYGA